MSHHSECLSLLMELVCHHNIICSPPASHLTVDAAATAGIFTSVVHPVTKPCLHYIYSPTRYTMWLH